MCLFFLRLFCGGYLLFDFMFGIFVLCVGCFEIGCNGGLGNVSIIG